MLLVWSTARYEKAVDVTDWLRQLSLAQYADAFAENAIDWAVLPTLTAEDLRDIGVVAVGQRRRLLDAIAALGAAPDAGPKAAASAPIAADAERRQLTV